MRVALIRFLSGSNSLLLKAAPGLASDIQWNLPSTLPSTNQVLSATAIAANTITLGWQTPGSGGGSGTVTSVGFTAPTEFSVSGSPITSSGSLGITWATQTPNRVLASPTSGGNGIPTFRALVAADIPNLDASKISTGVLGLAQIPTGNTSGTVALGNDSRFHTQNTDTGTNAASFQLNNSASGVRLKDNAGVLEVRNAADTGLANLVVSNLTVQGTTTTVNSTDLAIADNLITLNADFTTGTPTENAGIEVRRGSSANSVISWNESTDTWQAGVAGSELQIARKAIFFFTSANVSAGILTVTHNMGDVTFQVWDNLGDGVTPEPKATSSNILTLNFGDATITGTWKVVVTG